jgi:hypothetical protein
MPDNPKKRVDFDALFCVWALSGLHTEDFWDGTGLRGEYSNDELFQVGLLDWKARLRKMARESPNAQYTATLKAERKGGMVPGDINVPRCDTVTLPAVITNEEITPEVFIDRNRPKQVVIDWSDAQVVREYFQDKMRFAYMDQVDETTGKMMRVPYLSMADIRYAAAILKDLQTVQRLSLGLSSDNVGVSSSPQMPVVNVSFRKALSAAKPNE